MDLARQMPVADMPGDAHEMKRISAARLHQVFGRRLHAHSAAILQHQSIAIAQFSGVAQVKKKLKTFVANHRHAPPMPVVVGERDGVRSRVMAVCDGCGTDHCVVFQHLKGL